MIVVMSDAVVTDKRAVKATLESVVKSIWSDFKATNQSLGGKGMKFGAGLAVGSAVARPLEALTPFQWALRGFGPLPAEFTKSGAIQVFEFTTLERAFLVARAAAAKFVLVAIAYEGGVLIGSAINQTLSESASDAIGGTINEIVTEKGWRLLVTHPFGIGM
jgi:hypothetical protein